ncbi:hypothetical protein M9434_002080 [Picochlorum sp. BPE23]|nr:hypothetical protein M9435_006340 [Picochlorum sp. BPE23]KAI8113952.1 hypothetical protein M9434_002080 [Picochlorum sp. BPE23]
MVEQNGAKKAKYSFTPVPKEWNLEFPTKGETTEKSNISGGCRRIEDAYERICHLGQGTYGEVFKAKDKETGEVVAVKKIKMENEKEGFPITAVREIKILSKLAASEDKFNGELMKSNIIRLREIVRSDGSEENDFKGSVYMVFDYMEHDLAGLLDRANQVRLADATARGLAPHKANPPFLAGQVKRYMKQLLAGLALLKNHRILHRDLKNANLLVGNNGQLKIADFGLARSFYAKKATDDKDGLKPDTSNATSINTMTNRVITLWYRPPELCLGTEHYGYEVDIWSAGCILVEMLTGRPLFPGKDEVEQVKLICHVLGMPDENSMPGCTTWKDYDKIMMSLSGTHFRNSSNLRSVLQNRGIQDPYALDLIEKLLYLNPKRRIQAIEAAKHEWFAAEPRMLPLEEMPRYEESHELAMKTKRAEKKAARIEPPGHQSYGQQPKVYGTFGGHSQDSQFSQGRSQRSMPKWHEERR